MERLKDIFQFSSGLPLVFTQLNFWIFFAIIYTIYLLVYKKFNLRSLYLLVISLFFYYKTAGLFVFILILSTLIQYLVGNYLHRSQNKKGRITMIVLSVVFQLGILAWFKYAYFFTESYNQMFNTDHAVVNVFGQWANGFFSTDYFRIDKILLPAGISFITFQTLSYTLDIYRREVAPAKNIIDFGFFVSFFPHLVAGPIVRAREFIPQIQKKFSLTQVEFGFAIFLILKGLVKKIVVGDYLAVNFIDRVMHEPTHFTGFENMMAMFAYSLQVYCDFSGYTDVAIGLAKLMGFQLPQNFNSPYKAVNVGDFWKRWHMSLSGWLKDNLYIPLGGNKKGSLGSYLTLAVILSFFILMTKWYSLVFIFIAVAMVLFIFAKFFPSLKKFVNTDINLFLTMTIGGLWHGPSINFLIWGALNGAALIIYKHWRKVSPYEKSNWLIVHFWKIFFTFSFITFTRIFFRAPDFGKAKEVMNQIAHRFNGNVAWDVIVAYKIVFLIMLIGYIIHWLPSVLKERVQVWFIETSVPVKIILCSLIGFGIYQSVSSEFTPFIYFQF